MKLLDKCEDVATLEDESERSQDAPMARRRWWYAAFARCSPPLCFAVCLHHIRPLTLHLTLTLTNVPLRGLTGKWAFCVTINFPPILGPYLQKQKRKGFPDIIFLEYLPSCYLRLEGRLMWRTENDRLLRCIQGLKSRWLFKGPSGCNLWEFTQDLCLPYCRGFSLCSCGIWKWIIVCWITLSPSPPQPAGPWAEQSALCSAFH